MKFKQRDVIRATHKIPEIRYGDPNETSLTSFAGLVICQSLFQRLRIRQQLQLCFGHLRSSAIYPTSVVVLWLITHLLLGFRRLRERDYYADDPLVQRVRGLHRLPDVATISRSLSEMDLTAVTADRNCVRELVLDRLEQEHLKRVTLDFDGSVFSTSRHAEGTGIGFNKKKKGAPFLVIGRDLSDCGSVLLPLLGPRQQPRVSKLGLSLGLFVSDRLFVLVQKPKSLPFNRGTPATS